MLKKIKPMKTGSYTNENPLAKDHLLHYYFIKYDERGEIYAAYESSAFDRQ